MSGPGEYLPDPTEGITKPEDLPQPKVVLRSRNYEHYSCPRCHHVVGGTILSPGFCTTLEI